MKYLSIVLLSSILISCGYSEKEQMFFDFKKKELQSQHFLIDELDFKIDSLFKIRDITSKDSMDFYVNELVDLMSSNKSVAPNPKISFPSVKEFLSNYIIEKDTLEKIYQEAVLAAIRIDDYSWEISSKSKRDQAIEDRYEAKDLMKKVESLESKYNLFAEDSASVVGSIYRVVYQYNDPIYLGARRIFKSNLITNVQENVIVHEESISMP